MSTGRGRGIKVEETPVMPVGRGIMVDDTPVMSIGRGRGVTITKESNVATENGCAVSSMKNLKLNGVSEDYYSLLKKVTSKPNNLDEVIITLNKALDHAESNIEGGELVATVVCGLMSHTTYGDKIRAIAVGRIWTMYQDLAKIKSVSKLLHNFSFIGFMYLIQRQPGDNSRFDIYESPIVNYLKEILKYKLTEDTIKQLTKQLSLNGIALCATGNDEIKNAFNKCFQLFRNLLLDSSTEDRIKPYLLYLCDVQSSKFRPLSDSLLNFYSNYFTREQLESFKPIEIDLKLYSIK